MRRRSGCRLPSLSHSDQRTRFKAFVVVVDTDGHVGLGVKCAKEVATAIRGAIILAKLSVIPVIRGCWGNKIGKPHTVPCKVTGKCGSVTVRMVLAPRGAGIVAAHAISNTSVWAIQATFECLMKTYRFLTPEFWMDTRFSKSPCQEYTDVRAKPTKAILLDNTEKDES
ncbi:ribosomal protein [Musa troglodytarum]|uniref:Small ribosomal subunit protein uS5 n=1 Tax=Musa troglodytarum TaxID=320322 RepID=A0A9E7H507_9LILI|nr:ribosomal protein [Musa troglodytarum]